MRIIYPLHITVFDTLLDDDNKESETTWEEILYAILYLKNSDKDRFSELNKRTDNG